MQMLETAGSLDWKGWATGLAGAAISGGAGSVGSGFATTVLDKSHDINLLYMMAITFAFSGLISMMKFLQTHPVPDAAASLNVAADANAKAGAAIADAQKAVLEPPKENP